MVKKRMDAIVERVTQLDEIHPPGSSVRKHLLEDMAKQNARQLVYEIQQYQASYAAEIKKQIGLADSE